MFQVERDNCIRRTVRTRRQRPAIVGAVRRFQSRGTGTLGPNGSPASQPMRQRVGVAPPGSNSAGVAMSDSMLRSPRPVSDNDALTVAWTDDCGGAFTSATILGANWTAPATAPADGTCTLRQRWPDRGRAHRSRGCRIGQHCPNHRQHLPVPYSDGVSRQVFKVLAGGKR